MATTQTRISDLVGENPKALVNTVIQKFRTNNALISSDIVVGGPEVDLLMDGGTPVQALNFVGKVDTTQFNYSNDDFDDKGKTGKFGAKPYMALRHDLNWGWTYTDLVKIITKYDVKAGAVGAIPMFWAEVFENLTVASLKGVLAATPALVSGAVADAFDLDPLIDASVTMDDPQGQKTLVTSRKTLGKMMKMNKNAYVPASETNLGFARFSGYNLLLTEALGDQMTAIIQPAAFAFGMGATPYLSTAAIQRDELAGGGGGGEILMTRVSGVIAPQGYSYVGSNYKPGIAGLATAANWQKVVDDNSLIGIRAIRHAA